MAKQGRSKTGVSKSKHVGKVLWQARASKQSLSAISLESKLTNPDSMVNAAAKSLQSCPTLCDPIDSSPLGSSVPGILQARILEWVAISFSNA